MFNRIQILYVAGWNMLKFGFFLSLYMEIPPSDDKYWAINLCRGQERIIVFRMFFWCYNNVTRVLLCTAVSFNLVYLASMSILDTPPGATWKMKSRSLPSFMKIQCKQLWAEPWEGHIHKEEQIRALSESNFSVSSRDKTKCGCTQLLAASLVLTDLVPATTWAPGPPPSAIAQQALVQVTVLLQVRQEADAKEPGLGSPKNPGATPVGRALSSPSGLSVLGLLGLLKVLG